MFSIKIMFSFIYFYLTMFSLNNYVSRCLPLISLSDFFKPKLFKVIMFSHVLINLVYV